MIFGILVIECMVVDFNIGGFRFLVIYIVIKCMIIFFLYLFFDIEGKGQKGDNKEIRVFFLQRLFMSWL